MMTQSRKSLNFDAMIGRLLAEQSEEMKEKVLVSMEEVLAPFYQDGALVMPVAIWFVTAGVGFVGD